MKPSRSRSQTKAQTDKLIDLMDQAEDCCRNIATLARLLQLCGHCQWNDTLEMKLAADAGLIIQDEVRKLKDLLKHFRNNPSIG